MTAPCYTWPMSKRPGRPPSGPAGERTSQYPKATLRLPPATKATLTAVAALEGRAAWAVVDAALAQYVAQLAPAKRRALAAFGRA